MNLDGRVTNLDSMIHTQVNVGCQYFNSWSFDTFMRPPPALIYQAEFG